MQQTARPPPEGLAVTGSGAHAPPALILGGHGEAEPLQLQPPAPRHVRVPVSTADSAARLRPAPTPGGEGAVSPPRELEEGPRAGAQSYLKAHVATCTYTGT